MAYRPRRRGTILCKTCGRQYSTDEGEECVEAKSNLHIFEDTVKNLIKLDGPLFVDLMYQGYTIKEFAVSCAFGPTAWISVKPASWMTPLTPVHMDSPDPATGFRWSDGIIDEFDLQIRTRELLKRGRRIYVRNGTNANFLALRLNVPRECITFVGNPFGIVKLCNIFNPPFCPFHRHNPKFLCAMRNVQALSCYFGN